MSRGRGREGSGTGKRKCHPWWGNNKNMLETWWIQVPNSLKSIRKRLEGAKGQRQQPWVGATSEEEKEDFKSILWRLSGKGKGGMGREK